MPVSPFQLRAIATERDDGIEVQLLELDLAVRAASVDEIADALSYAIDLEYEIAKKVGLTPFVSIDPAPHHFERMWESAATPAESRHLHLRPEVCQALSIALRAKKPGFKLEVRCDKIAA